MNFWDILVIVYLFGEFCCIIYAQNSEILFFYDIQIPGESSKKIKEVKYATKKALESLNDRTWVEEPARIKATKRKNEFRHHTHTKFTDVIVRPEHGWKSKRLWDKAKKAENKYETIKRAYERGLFCYPPASYGICAKVLENSFFKREKLFYDGSVYVAGNGCIKVTNTIQINHSYMAEYAIEFRMCYAKKKNADGTESALVVYLQTAFKQPLLGGLRYFVLFFYLFDEITQQWVRPHDLSYPNNTNDGKFRYEAYLAL